MALDGVKQMVLDVDVPAMAPQPRENLPRQIFTAGMEVVVDLAELPREITCRHLAPGDPLVLDGRCGDTKKCWVCNAVWNQANYRQYLDQNAAAAVAGMNGVMARAGQ